MITFDFNLLNLKKGELFPYLLLLYFSLLTWFSAAAQLNDSVDHQMMQASFSGLNADSTLAHFNYLNGYQLMDALVSKSNMMSHTMPDKMGLISTKKSNQPTDFIFYALFFSATFLGLLKTIFSRYFNNLLRVFFNTSLRQSQLTDQLLQAQLPLRMFNLFFFLVAGQYVFFVLNSYSLISLSQTTFLITFILSFVLVYSMKSAAIYLFGWITGYKKDAQLYDFIVTLTNQLLSIVLLPILFFIAFSNSELQLYFLRVSYFIVGISFFFRYFRTYSNVRNQIKIGTFHFIIYIVGVELLPLLLIYKFAGDFLRNYL